MVVIAWLVRVIFTPRKEQPEIIRARQSIDHCLASTRCLLATQTRRLEGLRPIAND